MVEQVEDFKRKFNGLRDKAYQEVKQMDFDTILFRADSTHRSFLKQLIATPQQNTWNTLNFYWDYLNYGLLEHVVNSCASRVLKKEMQNFVDQLSTFKKTALLCDFITIESEAYKTPILLDKYKEVVVKMKLKWSECTLHDIELFMKALVKKFHFPNLDIYFKAAIKGCVCVTWLVSPPIATLLQQKREIIEREFFNNYNIDTMDIKCK